MRLLPWMVFLLALSCLGQTLELGEVVFLGSEAAPETVAVDIGPEGERLLAASAARAGLPIVQGSGESWLPVICSTIGQPTLPVPPNATTDVRTIRLETAGCSGSSGIVWVQ